MREAFPKTNIFLTFLLVFTLFSGIEMDKAYASEADILRENYKVRLTGGPSLNPAIPEIAASIEAITDEAQGYWDTMNASPTRTYLWSQYSSISNSYHILPTYERLKKMSLAYSTVGSTLYQDAALETAIVDALDYMYSTRYHEGLNRRPSGSGSSNWWHWEIGIPVALNDTVVLMYDSLTATQVTNYMTAVNHFTSEVYGTGANWLWRAKVVGVRGVIVNDATMMALARDSLSNVFNYVTSGDGFYRDGSFIQHSRIAYTGGYGLSLLQSVGDLMTLLHGSTWQVTDPDHVNVWEWIYDSFQPVIYKGALMDMVRGREIAREYAQDHIEGHIAVQAIMQMATLAPTAQANDFKRMVKGWILDDTLNDFFDDITPYYAMKAKEILADSSIVPADELIVYKQYSAMDRAVQHRPDYGFGLAMYSKRMLAYEAINSENNKGWYTGAGTTYLYNSDQNQYNDEYWPTVDSYRLPGTTVLSKTSATIPSGTSHTNEWVGGTDMMDLYGVSGMELNYITNALTGKKSWFMFDDEIVALGAGITSTDNIPVETIIENRKINAAGNNVFKVNGTTQLSALEPWYTVTAPTPQPESPQTLTGVQWAHLAGSSSGADIGYYFPETATVQALRKERKGDWQDLRAASPTTPFLRNYVTLWFDHGTNPTNGSYQYVVLPNKSSTQVSNYASNPNIEVLENTTGVQAVKETNLGLVGANFWLDAVDTVDLITVNKKASVMTKEVADTSLDVSVSDPTKMNTGTIEVELAREAGAYTADPGITVTQLSPTIKFTVSVNQAKGKTFKAQFDLTGVTPEPSEYIVDNLDAGATKEGIWKSGTVSMDRYGDNYVHDEDSEKGFKSFTFTPDLPAAGAYQVYMMWPEHFNRATEIPVDIVHAGSGSPTTKYVDQTDDGGVWNLLGTYNFNAGSGGYVKIRNDETMGIVVADAVKFVPLEIPDPVIVDNADLTGVVKTTGWKRAWTATDRYGDDYLHDEGAGKGTKSVTFTADLTLPGTYKVSMMWPAHFNRSPDIPVEIMHAGGTATTSIDQTEDGGIWNDLGTYTFGASGSVTISNDVLTGFVGADAVKFEYIP